MWHRRSAHAHARKSSTRSCRSLRALPISSRLVLVYLRSSHAPLISHFRYIFQCLLIRLAASIQTVALQINGALISGPLPLIIIDKAIWVKAPVVAFIDAIARRYQAILLVLMENRSVHLSHLHSVIVAIHLDGNLVHAQS